MPGEEEAVRGEAAAVLSRLMASPAHGTAVGLTLQRILPPGLVALVGSAATAPGPLLATLQVGAGCMRFRRWQLIEMYHVTASPHAGNAHVTAVRPELALSVEAPSPPWA